MPPTKKDTEQSFARLLQKLMDAHDPPMGITDLADSIQLSYEHARRLVRGIVVPTRFIAMALAAFFKANFSELEAVAKADAYNRKYGQKADASIFNPEVAPFSAAWPMLDDSVKADLLGRLKVHLSKATGISK